MSKPKIEYRCNLCEHCAGMSHADMLKHLDEVHHVPAQSKVMETVIMHGDAARSYFTTYHLTGKNIDLTKTVTCKREKTDPMYH